MTTEAPDLGALLEFVKRQRGFDFSGYKRSSLERRLAKRMQEVEAEDYGTYLDYLQVHPDEFAQLFDTILINVTAFFRDSAAWRYLSENVLPGVLEARGSSEIRVWSAGCASGEEAYSIAMLLVSHLGEEEFRQRVKIYATDVDDQALEIARQAIYPMQALKDVPEEMVERCFERNDGRLTFRKDLRRAVIFGRNDLLQDAPISRIDVLLCRNTLMYFTAEAQARIVARFNFALQGSGALFLGKSEMLLTHGDLFLPVDLKCRIFRKVPRETLRDRLAFVASNGEPAVTTEAPPVPLREGASDAVPIAQIVIDAEGVVAQANRQARALFGLAQADLGRPLQDLEVSYRPVELRTAIQQAASERRSVSVRGVVFRSSAGQDRRFDVEIAPVLGESGTLLGTSITFADVTAHAALADELDRSRRELEVAYEELQSTVEELETTNEELQSTNEELETTNEELQSTNEELETMNEELQSTNEELETINDELRERTTELNNVNASFEAILTTLDVAVVVVDPDAVVRVWNAQADDIWGVRTEEAVGQHVYGLDIGLPVERLRAPLRAALAGESPEALELEATNRRGRAFRCKVASLPLYGDGDGDGEVRGAIILMEPV